MADNFRDGYEAWKKEKEKNDNSSTTSTENKSDFQSGYEAWKNRRENPEPPEPLLSNTFNKPSVTGSISGLTNTKRTVNSVFDLRDMIRAKEEQDKMNVYEAYRNADDFSEYSTYDPNITEGLYDIVNTQKKNHGSAYDFSTNTLIPGTLSSKTKEIYDTEEERELYERNNEYASYMDDDQKTLYNYLYNKEGIDKAKEYFNAIEPELLKRRAEKQNVKMDELAQEHPVAATALRTATNVASQVVSPIAMATEGVGNLISNGKLEINPYSRGLDMSRITSKVTSSVGEKLYNDRLQKTGSTADASFAQFLYGVGTSMADSFINSRFALALSGGTGLSGFGENTALGMMGTGAAAQSYVELREKGYSTKEAFTLGTIAGAAEFFTERIGMETLLNPNRFKDSAFRYILKNGGAEGLEEVASNIINTISDIVILQDKSQWQNDINEYIKLGYTENKAFLKALIDKGLEMGTDFLAGALSGIGMSGVQSGIDAFDNSRYGQFIKDSGAENTFIDEALTVADASPNDSDVAEVGKQIQNKLDKGKTVPNEMLGRMVGAMEEQNAIEYNNRRQLESLTEKYTDEIDELSGIADVINELYNNQDSPTEYFDTANRIYNAGKEGVAITDIDTKVGDNPMMSAAAMEIYRTGQNAVRVYEGVKNGKENGERVLYDSTERNDGESSGVEVGRVEEVSGEPVGRRGRRAEIESIRSEEKAVREISAKEAGFKNGTDEKRTIVEGTSKSAQNAKRILTGMGFRSENIHFFIGGELTNTKGEKIRGAFVNNKNGNAEIYVQLDNETASAEQIARHEGTHYLVKKGQMSTKAFKAFMKKKHGAEMSEITQAYHDAFGDLSNDEMWEEIMADFAGGMNIFEGYERFKKADLAYQSLTEEEKQNGLNATRTSVKTENDGGIRFSRIVGVNGENIALIENSKLTNKDLRDPKKIAQLIANHIGELYTVIEDGTKVFIGDDLPNEYTRSKDTALLLRNDPGTARAKNRISDDLGLLIETARNRRWEKTRHTKSKDAKLGIYRFDSEFVIKSNDGKFYGYTAELVVRIAGDGRKYLYDIVNIKKSNNSSYILQNKQDRLVAYNATARSVASTDMISSDASSVNNNSEESYEKHSISSFADSLDMVARRDGTVTYNGKVVKTVTSEMVENSRMFKLIKEAESKGYIDHSDLVAQKEFIRTTMQNLIDMGGDASMTYAFSGSMLWSGIKENADKQYKKTIDFEAVCKKTEQMVASMSEAMVRKGRGLTLDEITTLYNEVVQADEPVPCPACYVFSRWIGLGGLLDNIKSYQTMYANATTAELDAARLKVAKKVEASRRDSENFGKARSRMVNDLAKRAEKLVQQRNNLVDKNASKAEIKAIDDEHAKVMEELTEIRSYEWIEKVRKKKNYKPVPDNVLFNLLAGENFASGYKDAWAFRTSQGAGYGKAITPYADARLGETIQGLHKGMKSIKVGEKNPFNQIGDTLDKTQRSEHTAAVRAVEQQNLRGGVRMQSVSDFRYEYALDYIQTFFELESVGAGIQTYTKVVEFVPIISSIGGYVNMSLMPKGTGLDENGNLVFSDIIGIDHETEFELQTEYGTAGCILMGISDNHIIAAMADDRIPFIIPYHKSGGRTDVIDSMLQSIGEKRADENYKYDDYSNVQSEKFPERANQNKFLQLRNDILKGNTKFTLSEEQKKTLAQSKYLQELYDRKYNRPGDSLYHVQMTATDCGQIFPYEYWDESLSIEDADENGRRYLEYCEQLGVKPKFSGDAKGKHDFREYPGYWKLLIDRRMYGLDGTYNRMKAINASGLNMDDLDTARAKERFGESMSKRANLSKTSNIVDRAFPETKFSRSVDSEGRTLTKEQQSYFAESKVRDENGNLLVVYHGTDARFNVFDRTKGRSNMDIQGSFFSPWELDASGYGGKVGTYYLNITNPAPEGIAYRALNRFKGQNNAGVKAREYLESLGYDGVNNGNEEYIAFNPEQIKRIDNKKPTNNPDVRYSRGAGYDGYSMSNNARSAYENGEMPLSKWTKSAIIDEVRRVDPSKADALSKVNLKTLKENLLENSSWHHTSKMYNRTDFYSISEDAIENLDNETISAWAKNKETKATGREFRGDISYIEWTGTKSHPKANNRILKDVNIEERGSFYIVTDDNGNEIIRKKIGSNGTSVTDYEVVERAKAREAEAQNNIRTNSSAEAYAFYEELVKNGYERSSSGNLYEKGKKPSSYDYSNGLENFFKKGDKRLSLKDGMSRENGYVLETWDGKKFVSQERTSIHDENIRHSRKLKEAQNDGETVSLRNQIRNASAKLNSMDVVSDIEVKDYNRQEFLDHLLKVFSAYDYVIDRDGFGSVVIDKKRIKQSFAYLNNSNVAEWAAYEAIPDVIKMGINIHSTDSHKGRVNVGSITFAAPITVNGVRGNMAVTLKLTDRNYYKMHRVLTPDGSVLVLADNIKDAEPTTSEKSESSSRSTISSASDANVSPSDASVKTSRAISEDNKNKVKFGSMFSGAGTIDYALRNIISNSYAVEYDAKIGGVFKMNNGENIFIDDVRNVDLSGLDTDHLHVSPVCKNYSNANNNAGEQPIDIETAKAAVKELRAKMPKTFSLENVKRYRKSEAMKLVTDALEELGYNYDVNVFKASDYGGSTIRERVFIRAVLDEELPPLPQKTEAKSWYEVTEDLIDDLPESPFKEDGYMKERWDAMKDSIDTSQPVLVLYGNKGGGLVYAEADHPSPTLTTKTTEARIVMPDGRVLRATPRVLARIQGLPDSFDLPQQTTTAYKVIGNGIPVELSQAVLGSLIRPVYGIDTAFDETKYSRTLNTATDTAESRLKEQYGSKASIKTDIDRFITAFNDGKIVTDDDMYRMLDPIAKKLMQNQSERDPRWQQMRDFLQNNPITINSKMKSDIPDFNSFRKKYFGALNLKEGTRTNMAEVYDRIREQLGADIAPDGVMNESDMLTTLAERYDELSKKIANPDNDVNSAKAVRQNSDSIFETILSTLEEEYNATHEAPIEKPKKASKIDRMNETIKQLKTENKSLKRANNSLTRRLETKEGKLAALKAQNKELKTNFNELMNLLTVSVKESDKLRSDLHKNDVTKLTGKSLDTITSDILKDNNSTAGIKNDLNKFATNLLSGNYKTIEDAKYALYKVSSEVLKRSTNKDMFYSNDPQNVLDISVAIESLSNDIIARVMDGERTVSDKRIDNLREKNRDRIAKLKADATRTKAAAISTLRANYEAKLESQAQFHRDYVSSHREARDARIMREKVEKHVDALNKKLNNPTTNSYIPKELSDKVRAVLFFVNRSSNYELKYDPKYKKNGEMEREYKRVGIGEGAKTAKTRAFEAFREYLLKGTDEENGTLIVSPELLEDSDSSKAHLELLKEYSDRPLGSLNSTELTAVYNAIREIEGIINTTNKMFNDARWSSVHDAIDAVYEETGSMNSPMYVPLFRKIQKFMRIDMLRPQTYFHKMGKTGDYLFRMFRNAQDESIKLIREVETFTRDTFKDVDIRKLNTEKHKVTYAGTEVEMTTSQIMYLYLLSKREQGIQHLLSGSIYVPTVTDGYTAKENIKSQLSRVSDRYFALPAPSSQAELEADIVAMATQIGTDNIEIADKLSEFMNGYLSDIGNETSLKVYNIERFNEQNYIPIKVHKNELNGQLQGDVPRTTHTGNAGFTKAVSSSANQGIEVSSLFDVFNDHATEMVKYCAWTETLEDMNRIFNGRVLRNETQNFRIKDLLDKAYGQGGANYFRELMADIATPKADEGILTGGLIGKYKAASVSANMRVIIQQPTAAIRAGSMLNAKYMLTPTAHPFKAFEEAKKYSPIAQWKDYGFFDADTGKSIQDILWENSSKMYKLQDKAMALPGKADSLAWGYLWNAVKAEQMDLNKDMDYTSDEFLNKCGERFTQIIDKTQVVDGILQRAQIARSKNAINKMATSFMSEPLLQLNMVYDAVTDYTRAKRTGDDKEMKKAMKAILQKAGWMLLAGLTNSLAQSIIDAMRNTDADKDYLEKLVDKMGDNTMDFVNPLQYIPYAKDAWSIIDGWNVDRMDMQGISDIVTSCNYVLKSFDNGKYNTGYALVDLATKIAKASGIPAEAVKKDALGFVNTVATQVFHSYEFSYDLALAQFNLSSNAGKSAVADILYAAYKNDQEAYRKIRQDCIERDIFATSTQTTAQNIDARIKAKIKKEAESK